MHQGAFSEGRLARMHDIMGGYVERGEVPGLVTLLSRGDDTRVDVIGSKALGVPDAMQRDTIFRITSMTKPITAVATMILIEECTLRLDDPVDRFLPELANRRVLARIDAPLDDTVPARRPITVRDLLTFKLGLGLVMGSPNYPILAAIKELGLVGFGMPDPSSPHDPDEWMRRLGSIPLMAQPGDRWMYNTGSYVLGVLIARASGQPLEAFFRERIFEPLGMKDTSFTVPSEKIGRLATSYLASEKTGALELLDGIENSAWAKPPAFPDGGAGLVSTVDDFHAFGRMLLNGGKLGNERILSRHSVATMTTDCLTPRQRAECGFVPGYWDHSGWGFGVSIVTSRDSISSVPGRYGWDGGYGTSWSSDPAEGLVAILMGQRAGFPLFSGVWRDFWTSTYQAIDD